MRPWMCKRWRWLYMLLFSRISLRIWQPVRGWVKHRFIIFKVKMLKPNAVPVSTSFPKSLIFPPARPLEREGAERWETLGTSLSRLLTCSTQVQHKLLRRFPVICFVVGQVLINNYSPNWRWQVEDIYRAVVSLFRVSKGIKTTVK